MPTKDVSPEQQQWQDVGGISGRVGKLAPASSGRCPKDTLPPRQRREGESEQRHELLSPDFREDSHKCGFG